MKIGFKEIKPMAKSNCSKVNKPEDMVTRRRVLLLKSQLGLQQKAIPQSINLLSNEYLKRKRKKSSKRNQNQVLKEKESNN